jgi:hypothetical protein
VKTRGFYLIEVRGGLEPFVIGPFSEGNARDGAAKAIHKSQTEDDSLFWANIDDQGGLEVGSYIAGFFLETT